MTMFGGNQPTQREKYWDELSDQEKMERTRQQLRAARREVQEMRRMVDMLLHHQHAVAGGVMAPLDFMTSPQVRYDMDKEALYF